MASFMVTTSHQQVNSTSPAHFQHFPNLAIYFSLPWLVDVTNYFNKLFERLQVAIEIQFVHQSLQAVLLPSSIGHS
jgi:hypothetical protein